VNVAPSNAAAALFSPALQRVLALLYGQPRRRFQSGEIIRLVGSGTGATHRVLTRLADAGLVTVARVGNQKHYQANSDSPVFTELQGLVVKTIGVVEPLRRALAPLAKKIHAAFVYGSVAKGTERAHSDVDLMVITDSLTYPDVYGALHQVETLLARQVNANVMTRGDWRAKRSRAGTFAGRIARLPHLFVIGSDDDIR
jgi:predicted nucleotidyltransferase